MQGIRDWEGKYQEVWKYRDCRKLTTADSLTGVGVVIHRSLLEATNRAPPAAYSLRLC